MIAATLDALRVEVDPREGPIQWKLTDLSGWHSSAPIRGDFVDQPFGDGGFDPGRTYRGIKPMALQGVVYGGTTEQAEEECWDALNALAPNGGAMTLTVEGASGIRTMQVWLRGEGPQVMPFRHNAARFSVPIAAVDPRKYGPMQPYEVEPPGAVSDGLRFPLFSDGTLWFGDFAPAGVVTLQNVGTAAAYPIIRVRGPIATQGVRIASGGMLLEYIGSLTANETLTLSPYAGGRATIGTADVTQNLTIAQWVAIEPGEVRTFAFTPLGTVNPAARMRVEWASAWW